MLRFNPRECAVAGANQEAESRIEPVFAPEDLGKQRYHFIVDRAVVGQDVGRRQTVDAAFHIPCRSRRLPSTSNFPAAMSQGLSPNSQNPSSRPQAT